jgi:tetratricopeptide (TPR) repeat protein
MNKAQIWAILAATVLFFGLYFGLDNRPHKHTSVEKSTDAGITDAEVSFDDLLATAKSGLTEASKKTLAELEQAVASADNTTKPSILKQISAFWYQEKQLPVAGGFAEQVATLENADSSWSVAGGTFYTALVTAQDPELRDFCAKHAVAAFEKAAALAPAKVEHQVNQALVWAENPNPQNPMQAVMQLRELETKHPESAPVYNALGRLAIKTGQWQRAVDRLEKAWSLEKKNPNTPCLLARAYEGLGNTDKATEFAALCKGQ